jgi:peptidoglycan/xylan/chitin deacetylase (PgdA/CDA1 family)
MGPASGAPGLAQVARAAAPDAGPIEPPAGSPPLATDLHASQPRTPMRLAVAESVQSAVQGIQRLAPLPPLQPVSSEVITRPERAGRRVALTFDACSTLDRSFYDERVMKVLRDTRTPATLFVSGRWAENHQSIVKELAANPLFEIANHSYIHPHMLEMPAERQEHELLWTQQILLTLTGKLPRFFRPPYGEMNDDLIKRAAALGLRTVEFDFPSGDPDKKVTKERMVKWVLAKARPGSIVVMHMNRNGWHTGEALPDIIAGLRAKGFELSRVGDLVDADEAAAGSTAPATPAAPSTPAAP